MRRMVALSLTVLILVIAPVSRLWSEEPTKPAVDDYELLKLFADTLDQVERNYVKENATMRRMKTSLQRICNPLGV